MGEKMADIMFDTNIFNRILDGEINSDDLIIEGDNYYVTHVQKDELERCPDEERRKNLLEVFNDAEQKEIPTESTVLNTSRFGKAKLGDGELLEEIRKGNLRHTEDALIGETAIKKDIVLISEDGRIRSKVNSLGGTAVSIEEFKDRFIKVNDKKE